MELVTIGAARSRHCHRGVLMPLLDGYDTDVPLVSSAWIRTLSSKLQLNRSSQATTVSLGRALVITSFQAERGMELPVISSAGMSSFGKCSFGGCVGLVTPGEAIGDGDHQATLAKGPFWSPDVISGHRSIRMFKAASATQPPTTRRAVHTLRD